MPHRPTYEELEKQLQILRKNEEYYRLITQNSTDMISKHDSKGIYNYVSPACQDLIGYTYDELIGLSAYDFFHPDDLERIQKSHQTIFIEPSIYTVAYRIQHKNGRYIWVETKSKAIRHPQSGDIEEIIATTRDITERKQAEDRLKEQSKTLHDILEHAGEGICVCHNIPDYPHVRFTHWNPHMTTITGYTLDEINRMGWYQTMYPDPEIQQEAVERMSKMRMGDDIRAEEWSIQSRDGGPKTLLISTSVLKEENDEVHVLAIIHDISDRIRAEKTIRQNEKKFRCLVEEINEVIYSIDTNGIVTYVSPAVMKSFRYEPEEIIGKSYMDFVHPEDHRNVQDKFHKIIAGQLEPSEYRLRSKDGGYRWIKASSKPIFEDGQPKGLRGSFSDITEEKRLQSELQQAFKMEAIGTLAGGIAHEFNNLLGIILGNTELAIDDIPTWNPAADCLQEIRETVLRAKNVVRQIVSFTRKTPTTQKAIQISTIIRETLKLIKATIPASIQIQQDIQCTYEQIFANPTEIKQVLINLCSNSAHAMEQDTGILKIRLEHVVMDDHSLSQYRELSPGEYVKLTVADTGSGIVPDIMDRIFDPYFTTKDVDKGLGMGLAVVFGIVKKHEGAINIFSKVGTGTTAEVFFPLATSGFDNGSEISNYLPGGSERILFVDDEPDLVFLQGKILEKQGYQVTEKTDSREALQLFQHHPESFDLVITDMSMPNMPGDRLIQELIQTRSDIPIILCTGHSDRVDADMARKLGAREYIMKPIEKKELLQTVRNVLDESCQ